MELIEVAKWVAYVATGVVGWFVKVLWDAQKDLQEDMKHIELNLLENYIKRNDFRAAMDSLKEDIKYITQPISNKLDRIEGYLLHQNKDK